MSVSPIKDLRPLFGPVRDQGARPTCLAFAASDAHAALRPGWAPLSCEYAYYHAQRRAGLPPSQGSRLAAMLEALRQDGQPAEGGWPYLTGIPDEIASWLPPDGAGLIYRRSSQAEKPALNSIIAWLEQDRPVILLSTLSASFYQPSAEAVVDPAPGELPTESLRHAVIGCGHGTVLGQRALLVRNSWGLGWGSAGHAWITESFLNSRLYAAAVLMEDLDVPGHSAAA